MARVTIMDIADALNISRNTVSKALNNADGISEATRQKVLQKAAEMGYKQFFSVPNRSLFLPRQPDQCEIALLVGNSIVPPHFASLTLDKLTREAAKIDFVLKMHRVESADILSRSLPFTFHSDCVSAIICVEMFDHAYSEMLCGLGIPILFIDGPSKRNGFVLPADQLYMDNTTAITQFVNDMLKQGKSKIGFIGDYEHCQSFFERYSAFRCAMLLANAPVEERFCIKMNEGDSLSRTLDSLSEFPEVFICANDFIAADAIYALQKLGKSVPGDVLVSGFDDAPISRILTPSLTTVHIHTQIMAVCAIDILMTRIAQPEMNYRTIYTEAELIYRDSTKI